MTKKDYIKFAQILTDAKNLDISTSNSAEEMRHYIAGRLAMMFQIDNERFDMKRFYDASEIETD